MASQELTVLYEDNHLLVLDKPAMVSTMGAEEGEDSLFVRAKAYLREKYAKPGNVYLGVVSRLDKPVTGAVVFARTSKAASRLSESFRSHLVVKHYLAIVPAGWVPVVGRLDDWVQRNETLERMVRCSPNAPEGQQASLSFRIVGGTGGETILAIRLHTGRRHQIRLQLSSRGFPILGDTKYGSQRKFPRGIALHSAELLFPHPTQDRLIHIPCRLPPSWGSRKLETIVWPEAP
jgi:23S rRNA pseudouridine1911/1915/1917 synthase